MNPLTQIKNTQKASRDEIELGLSDKASWHGRFKHSAYVFAGGLPYELTEGDILAVFSQYGEVVDLNLARDKKTGKPKGFAFLAYEDQRSTVLAVDNLSGAKVAGRVIRVEHVDNYRKKRAEMEGEPIPESDEEEEEARAAEGVGPAAAAPRAERPPGERAGPSQVAGDEPWASGSSVFALLSSARAEERWRPPPPRPGAPPLPKQPPLPADSGRAHKKDRKEKKEKMEKKKKKKEKKDKRPEGERGRLHEEPPSIAPPAAAPPAGPRSCGGRADGRGGRASRSPRRQRSRSPPRQSAHSSKSPPRRRSRSPLAARPHQRGRSPGGVVERRGRADRRRSQS